MADAIAQTLPQVMLRNLQVPLQVLSLIPLETVEKYQVSAFEVGETELKLAVVYPEQLKQGFYTALTDIGTRIGRTISLYRTDAGSMREVTNLYKKLIEQPLDVQPAAVPATQPAEAVVEPVMDAQTPEVPQPPLFVLGRTVALNYLKRIPYDYSIEKRLVCVDFLPPNTYWFISDTVANPDTIALLHALADVNGVICHLIPVTSRELNDLLRYYKDLTHKKEKSAVQIKKEEDAQFLSEVYDSDSYDQAGSVIVDSSREIKKVEKTYSTSEKSVEYHETTAAEPVEGAKKIEEQIQAEAEVSPEVVPDPEAMPMPRQVVLASDVVVPDIQATIISQESERPGVAGVIQRISHSFGPKTVEVTYNNPIHVTAPLSPSVVSAAAGVQAAPLTITEIVAVEEQGEKKGAKPNKPKVDDNIDIGKLLDKPVETVEELKGYVRSGSIPRIVAAIVNFAIHEKASDIHIEAFNDEIRVRYRVDGQLSDAIKLPPDIHAAMVSRIKILTKLRLDETRVPQDGRFEVNFDNAQVDLRVSILPTVHGEKVVMRILDKGKGVTSLDSLGVMGLAYQNVLKSIQKPFGICLATGPTGSGKSTSLYAILGQIATPNVNVSTLEDPVEYEMKGVNQSQIRPKIGFTFAEGLRSLLRQDPNIIMVGEIRDGETANMATQAALTGHLVLSTLHTNDAAGAIPRLENMGIEPFLIASSLNMVIGQRLVRKICQTCKQEITMPGGVRDKIVADVEKIRLKNSFDAVRILDPMKFWQGMGCDECGGKGYQGRIGIYEVLIMTTALEQLALDRAPGGQIQEVAEQEGMLTMYQDGLLKVGAGLTTLDEVLRETSTK